MTATVDPAALRAARQDSGLTQHQVAYGLGVAGGEAVARWERGASEPKPETLVRAAKLLGVEPAELLKTDGGAVDLRFLRLCAGLTAAEVASRLHVSKVTYLRWERGAFTNLPAAETLHELALVLAAEPTAVEQALRHARKLAQRTSS